tara:strand:+ start:644 stop:1072 length:429 start_codon:yes stop_codon:yes gene_type:complete
MNLVPIIQNKLSKEKWLNLKVKYEEITLQDILKEFSDEIYYWINVQLDIYLSIDNETLHKNMITILYHDEYKVKMYDENYEYYNLKYNEDVYYIFKKYYDMICIDIGNKIINNNYMILFDYLYDNIKFYEEDDSIEEHLDDR